MRKLNVKNVAIISAILIAVHIAALALDPRGKTGSLISNVIQALASLLAAYLCFDAAGRSHQPVKRFWKFLGASYAIWCVAGFWWIFAAYESITVALPSLVYFLFFFAYAPLAVALLDCSPRGETMDRLQLFDFLQVSVVLIVAYYYILHFPALWTKDSNISSNFAISLDIRNVFLVTGIFVRGLMMTRRKERRLLFSLGFAFLAYCTGSMISTYMIIVRRRLDVGNWQDIFWSVPFLLAAVIAARWDDTDAEKSTLEASPEKNLTRVLVVNLSPLVLPLMAALIASRIATSHVQVGIAAVFISFALYGIRIVLTQLREQKAIRELKIGEERFQSLFSNQPLPMLVCEAGTLRFLEVNSAALEKYEYTREEFLAMTAYDLRPPEDIPLFLNRVKSESVSNVFSRWRHKTKSGRIMHVEVMAHRFNFMGRKATLVAILDMTERMQLEQQLRQAQKMEVVGTLAGGIAHDFNNLLTVIKGYSTLLLENLATRPEAMSQVRQIEVAADRAANLTQRLLAFSRKQVLRLKVVDVNESIQNVGQLLERLIGENIQIQIELAENIGKVKADPSQLDQVLINLAVNARDAMPQGGVLRFRTSNADVDADRARLLDLEPGHYVCLHVSDTGSGMDAETLSHIFEPFFTTKEQGKGSGLGLSTVYGIVKQSGGNVLVESQPGKGSCFSVYLPCGNDSPKPAPAREQEPAAEPKLTAKTILLAEDEEPLREFLQKVLTQSGFNVIAASCGADAIAKCQNNSGMIDLLLTDMIMPGMNGHELASRLLPLRPEMKVLFISGYAEEAIYSRGVADMEFEMLAKPFSHDTLIHKVRKILEGHTSSAA